MGRIFIADGRRQTGHQHQGAVQIFLHSLPVGLDAPDTVLLEGAHAVSQQTNGLVHIIGKHRHEDIQLKVALARADADGGIIAHHLHRDHSDGLTLGGVHLARHDRGARLILRNGNLADAAAGTGRQPADVVGHLHQVAGQCLQGAVGEHIGILGGQRMVLVVGGHKLLAR